jgi:hypothetical protein
MCDDMVWDWGSGLLAYREQRTGYVSKARGYAPKRGLVVDEGRLWLRMCILIDIWGVRNWVVEEK